MAATFGWPRSTQECPRSIPDVTDIHVRHIRIAQKRPGMSQRHSGRDGHPCPPHPDGPRAPRSVPRAFRMWRTSMFATSKLPRSAQECPRSIPEVADGCDGHHVRQIQMAQEHLEVSQKHSACIGHHVRHIQMAQERWERSAQKPLRSAQHQLEGAQESLGSAHDPLGKR